MVMKKSDGKKFPQFYLDTSGIVKPIVTSPAKSSEDLKLAKVKLLRQSSSGPFRSEPLINDYEQIQTIPVHGILPTERLFAESDDVTFQKINRIQDSDFNVYFPIAFESPFIILLRSILDFNMGRTHSVRIKQYDSYCMNYMD